jgi:hypothetical protein
MYSCCIFYARPNQLHLLTFSLSNQLPLFHFSWFRFELDVNKISAHLDTLVISFKAGLEKFVAWYHNFVSSVFQSYIYLCSLTYTLAGFDPHSKGRYIQTTTPYQANQKCRFYWQLLYVLYTGWIRSHNPYATMQRRYTWTTPPGQWAIYVAANQMFFCCTRKSLKIVGR